MTRPLDILLIESRPGDADAAAAELGRAGHRLHRCWHRTEGGDGHSGDRESLCRGVTEETCPLDEGIDVALLVRGRVAPRPSPTEVGVSCALRAGVPVVEEGSDALDPFGPWVAARVDDDVTRTCEVTAATAYDPVADDVRARTAPLLAAQGIDAGELEVRFEASGPGLVVRICGPELSASAREAVCVRALDALRVMRRRFTLIDVAYDTEGSGPAASVGG